MDLKIEMFQMEKISNGCILVCRNLKNWDALKYWNVSNGEKFRINKNPITDNNNSVNYKVMFAECFSLKNINGIKDWNISNGLYFGCMFNSCKFQNLNAIKNWNISMEIFWWYVWQIYFFKKFKWIKKLECFKWNSF